jgi:hypothetical protein
VRRRQEQDNEGRHAPAAADLVLYLSDAFGDRVNDRLRLLTGLLRSAYWECQLDALYPAGNLIAGWRGDYQELVAVIGERIHGGHPRTRHRAVHVLERLGGLAAPAADALAVALDATTTRALPHTEAEGVQLPWVIEWPQGPSVSPALGAFARMGDKRALPMLAWALDHEPMPEGALYCVVALGPRAAPLIPQLLRRLRHLPTDDRRDHRRDNVIYALSAIGPAATEALPDLLGGPITFVVLESFAAIGADAESCVPLLRRAVTSGDQALEAAAARSLWRVAGDPCPALAVADRWLAEDSESVWRAAADLLAELGQATRTQLTELRRLTRREDRTNWTPLGAAHALWRITGDPGPLLPVLEQAWTSNSFTKLKVASLWVEVGPAATGARPLLTAELGQIRRLNNASYVPYDEELLIRCRAALATIGAGG